MKNERAAVQTITNKIKGRKQMDTREANEEKAKKKKAENNAEKDDVSKIMTKAKGKNGRQQSKNV